MIASAEDSFRVGRYPISAVPSKEVVVRAVMQRVREARVLVDGAVVGAIAAGWVVLLGVGPDDTEATADEVVEKMIHLRAFEDADGKMNRSSVDVGAEFLVVSQFTLYAAVARGRRPSFTGAAPPDRAAKLVDQVVAGLRAGGARVATGRFGTVMEVVLVNQGPVTIVLTTDGWEKNVGR